MMRGVSRRAALIGLLAVASDVPERGQRPIELHQRIASADADERRVALTLDACSGAYDADLVEFLIRDRIAATLFLTGRWIHANPSGVAVLRENLDLFEIENHGENHIPAVLGRGESVYGIPGEPDVEHLRREILDEAESIRRALGVATHWYRAATAEYDRGALEEIRRLGFRVAGFSVNADAGATLDRADIVARMRRVRGGDVIIAHMNKPRAETFEGLKSALPELRQRGLRFVRLDEIELETIP